MPRRNARAAKPRLKRNRHAPEVPFTKKPTTPPKPIELMVRPAGRCPSGKSRYGTREDAAQALKDAQRSRERKGLKYAEKRFYECSRCPDPTTGTPGFHLTSRSTFQGVEHDD